MEKITFKNGEAPYLSAATLDILQTNIENAINQAITNFNTELNKKLNITAKATSIEAIAGTNNTKYTTPSTVKSAITKAIQDTPPSSTEIIQTNGTASTTNVYSASAVDTKINTLKEVELYNNPSGTTGEITLNEALTNYQYLEIYGKYDGKYDVSQKVYNPSVNNIFNVIGGMLNQNADTGYFAITNYKIQGTKITAVYYGEFGLHTNAFTTKQNKIHIIRVVGYK